LEHLFFNNWTELLRTLVLGVLAYISLIVLLRIAGKRTLAKMNAFDFIVTVALGSILATILLSKDVPLAKGTLAVALLVALQFLITWSSVRLPWIRDIVTGEPSLLYYRSSYVEAALRKTRTTRSEVEAAVRSAGLGSLEKVEAVVLETDGSISVIKDRSAPGASPVIGMKGLSAPETGASSANGGR
jgi:uncharacterized membrane protein YcaP (DUF421 family)